ncbi:MAG: hypothetical protein C4330_10670 [Chitinophagaceae bacterium]
MKRILFCLLVLVSLGAKAQVYNNEWIDYNKTYYKFKVGRTGVYRIPAATLSSAGLNNIPAQYFQLWRNGKEVPIYTSVASGNLSASDYIEFWGEMNDGKPDLELYKIADYQLNNKWSLESDTAIYFLTVNPTGTNLRFQTTPNNVSGTTLTPEPYFMYTTGKYFNEKINPGQGIDVGDAYLYLSDYDMGEGWSSNDIDSGAIRNITFNNLFVYTSGPQGKFKIAVSGNKVAQRQYQVNFNGVSIIQSPVNYFDYRRDSASIDPSTLSANTASIDVKNLSASSPDRMVIHQAELSYPRQFNFGGSTNFEFSLPASAVGNYLVISNFSYGTATPVLYDVTNGQRYAADLTAAPSVRFVLLPSATQRNLVLVSEEPTNITNVTSLQTRSFTNLNLAANQGDYLIITSPALFAGPNGTNPVDDYRAYRSSLAGGSYNAKIYLVDELVDQFGFGIKMNPTGIRNFLRFARARFITAPKSVLLIGKGVNYVTQRGVEGDINNDKLNFVPSFGWPASDILLTADPGSPYPQTPIGRLSVINGNEVAIYLKKVKDYEAAQKFSSPYIADKAWMKNVVHINGIGDPTYYPIIRNNLDAYKSIIVDTLYGAKVTTFEKTISVGVQQLNIPDLFQQGISLITYFGHSSSTTLEFNLDNPENYNNFGKYPMFIGLGCNAGDFFKYSTTRLSVKETISEKYVLAQDRGTIGFIASTHYGVIHYLDLWAQRAYKNIGVTNYGKGIGEIMKATAADALNFSTPNDLLARANAEQSTLHGDPVVSVNSHPQPDYVVEDSMVKVSPSFISVADANFTVNATYLNIGKAINHTIVAEITHQHPDGSVTIHRDTIPGIRYATTLTVAMPINPARDKGTNIINVKIDADNEVQELFETNNTVSKTFTIFEAEARPVYPYNYAIINRQNIVFKASTANALDSVRQYKMELDTTELFNSPFKITTSATSSGGVIQFSPTVTFRDSSVYYWRVAPVPNVGTYNWNTASFVYLPAYDLGYNQSHLYQHLKSKTQLIHLNSTSRQWQFDSVRNNLLIKNGVFFTATNHEGDLSVSVNSDAFIRSACVGYSVIFNVFDPITFKPLQNPSGRYGSAAVCAPSRLWNFEYSYMSPASRKLAMDFMDSIPVGSYVVVRNILNPYQSGGFVNEWKNDTLLYGTGNSLYHKLKNAGMAVLDSFVSPKAFGFIYQKGSTGFSPVSYITRDKFEIMTLSADMNSPSAVGYITSPVFGPAKAWKELRWAGNSTDNTPGDDPIVEVLGIKTNGNVDTLFRVNQSQQVFNISSVNATVYPNIKLRMVNSDTVNYTAYQMRYWRLTYVPVPEGAIAPNIFFQMRDTTEAGEPIDFKVAFKNVSEVAFPDSIKVKLVVTDRNNTQHVLPVARYRAPLNPNDTLSVRYNIDTRQFSGMNSLYVEINPDNDQPEQYHFNNFLYKNFYVKPDILHPVLDVTFDNVHILNHDIVSSKPDIMIKLKDESKWMLLDDTSLVSVQVRYPNGSLRTYHFDADTLRFTPATQMPNADNTATVNLKPYLQEDGEYELIVTGKDKQGNTAGDMQYRVSFDVINKPMISNMLNYPNPFTTSTAFVFTLTGSDVPQYFKIQILTITGKIVREITKEELGPIHIGRNITEFKWDGTDQYGQKVANGVYLYRVVTQLNGQKLDNYKSDADNTDKYFNKGYGKMYLMH